MREFLEGLTATHDAKFFLDEAERLGNPLRDGIRGSPLNYGSSLEAVHPVIRTNREFDSSHVSKVRTESNPSRHWMEIRVREQGLHQADQWCYSRRV
jgi:hypothetical protein